MSDPLFLRIAAFVRDLDEAGYAPGDQIKALAAQITVILLAMTPAQRDTALAVHLLTLADMFVDRRFRRQIGDVVAANVRRLH